MFLSFVGQHDDRGARHTSPTAHPEHGRLLGEGRLATRMLTPEARVERSRFVLLANRDRVFDE